MGSLLVRVLTAQLGDEGPCLWVVEPQDHRGSGLREHGVRQGRKAKQDLQGFLGSFLKLKISPWIQTVSESGIHI